MSEIIMQLKNMPSTDPKYVILLDELMHSDDLSIEEKREALLLAERFVKGDEGIKEKGLIKHE